MKKKLISILMGVGVTATVLWLCHNRMSGRCEVL